MNPAGKYVKSQKITFPSRRWPRRQIEKAPIWCSVDLRDGNQSLPAPMTVEQKIDFFATLVRCGFKQIEIGFPSASQTEFEFTRRLIEGGLIPDDVTIQVLVQARGDLINTTVESLKGAKKVIIHMYNSTSPAQRRVVFGMTKEQVAELARRGTGLVRDYSKTLVESGTKVMFEYSPESFSATEIDFSVQVCESVMEVWGPTEDDPIILNLPETVQVATPNVYADQIEWFCRSIPHRNRIIISVHTHNDRGTGVASTELALLAGAQRVEGTLFGNGERTGNLDIVNLALNLYAQGIDPQLDFSDINSIKEVYRRCTGMDVPVRQPYSGELVFTAFSGSHQDAIRKGLRERQGKTQTWDVPYLVIDPEDVGSRYEEIIRVNGQSGKGGIAFVLEHNFGICLPKAMQREFGPIAGEKIDRMGREAQASELRSMLWEEYINKRWPYYLVTFQTLNDSMGCHCDAMLKFKGDNMHLSGTGNGPIDAFVRALQNEGLFFTVSDQSEHALSKGQDAAAIGYVRITLNGGSSRWGAGIDTNIELANIKAVISAINRSID